MPRSPVLIFWRMINPVTRPLAGWAPWWVLVETRGRRSGKRRGTPLAAGPHDAQGMLVIAVHGRQSAWVLNAAAMPAVRIRHKGRWRQARAQVLPWDPAVVRTFNFYARSGPTFTSRDPLLVRF